MRAGEDELNSLLISYERTRPVRDALQAVSDTTSHDAAALSGPQTAAAAQGSGEPGDASAAAEDGPDDEGSPEDSGDESHDAAQVADAAGGPTDDASTAAEGDGDTADSDAAAHSDEVTDPDAVLERNTEQLQEVAAAAANADPEQHLHVSTDTLAVAEGGGSMYFIKKSAGRVAVEDLNDDVEVGVLVHPDPLRSLQALFSQVYIPIFQEQAGLDGADGDALASSVGAAHGVDADLLSCVTKFLTHVSETVQHLTGNVQLAVPDVDVARLADRDDEALTLLEGAMHEWTLALQVRRPRSAECATCLESV